ncbi:hypothetical protein [Streptomyces mexicanus]|uniref:hypothetical protein n=1 Tax=Streptomyces mexicanus TaxID=178566 RepID=UPI0036874743
MRAFAGYEGAGSLDRTLYWLTLGRLALLLACATAAVGALRRLCPNSPPAATNTTAGRTCTGRFLR